MLSDVFYVAIPLANSAGNVLLKLSVGEARKANRLRFLLLQFAGYGIFVMVAGFSYMFLMTHDASLFVVIFSLNYLTTLYASRWFLGEAYATRDVMYDALVIVGIVIFFSGSS